MQALRSFLLTLCFFSLTYAEQSPVFLWGAHSVAKPSLSTISGGEFVELVTPLLADKALVVFLENDLSSKDFLCSTVGDGNSCFAHLQVVNDKTYYAAVENPVKALRAIGGEHEYITIDDSGKLSKPLETVAGKINFLRFDDKEQSVLERSSTLQSHDSIIATITSQFVDKVFFMYASAPSASSLKRQRRQTSDASKDYVFRDGANLLLYYKSLSIIEGKSTTDLEIDTMSVKSNTTAMSVTLTPKTGSPLNFDLILVDGYFIMKNLLYNNVMFISSEVYAPTDFSYFCGNLSLSNIPSEKVASQTLKWNSLQFQAPFGHTKNTTFAFGDAWHCVGFLTGGILSGLLIVALLLTITFIGICWMMDINTMDRFDDPKGKTITINASE